MVEWLQHYTGQLKKLWDNLDKRAKIIVGIGIVGVIIALSLLILWNGSTNYQPLFSNLSTKDASAIVNNLEEKGIPYQLSDDSKTILVPGQVVHKTRLDMAAQGLPTQGVVGFEIFDNSKFGTTDFERRVNFYRALGGELSRSIQEINSIDYAKVQISPPDDSLFAEEQKPAAASVLLKLKSGYRLTNSQVSAISNLVASGVQGLVAQDVTIVDTNGNLLTVDSNQDKGVNNGQLTLNQFEIQHKFEDGLRSDLKSMLTKVLGPNNFSVQVQAKLNFDQREVESKTYSPVVDGEGIVRSSEKNTESYQGANANTGGAPGTTSNIPQYQSAGNNGNSGSYDKSDVTTNYEINQKIEHHVYSSGDIEKLSVSVMINKSLDRNQIDKIRNSIQAAVGYNQARGDVIQVTDFAFDDSLKQEVAQAQAAVKQAQQRKMYIYAGLIAFILIAVITTLIILRRSGVPAGEEYAGGQNVDFTVGQELEEAQSQTASTELTDDEKRRIQMKEDLEDVVLDQPEEVAQLLKTWLMDE